MILLKSWYVWLRQMAYDCQEVGIVGVFPQSKSIIYDYHCISP